MTLLEVLIALAIAAALVAALSGVVSQSLQAWAATRERNELTRQARFAMERMRAAVSGTSRLVLPLAENPNTVWSESAREVLAVTLDPTLDRDGDGFADADNDRDGQVDEDVGSDNNADGESGILGIDDDHDGEVDESNHEDDDEDEDDAGSKDEEAMNGVDDDADGAVDEDLDRDMNQDGEPGILGVDDDGDGEVDESNHEDDDEDEDDSGGKNEDWLDTVVFFRQGGALFERLPNPHATSGLDYGEHPIAENVSQFRVDRLAPGPNDRAVLVDITLELTGANGETVTLDARVRVGGAR